MADTRLLADDQAGMAPLNFYRHLQSITARTPAGLATMIRRITMSIRIEGFTATPGAHTCYFTSAKLLRIVTKGENDNGNTGRA